MTPGDADVVNGGGADAPFPALADRIPETDDPLHFEAALKPQYRPVIIRGLAAGWPAVRAGARAGEDGPRGVRVRAALAHRAVSRAVKRHGRARIHFRAVSRGVNPIATVSVSDIICTAPS